MNVEIGKRRIPLFRLSRVVLLCPGCGDLHGSAPGLPLPAVIRQQLGIRSLAGSVGGCSGGKGWPVVFGFRWCLWDVIIECTFLSLHFLAEINIGDLIGKISKGII